MCQSANRKSSNIFGYFANFLGLPIRQPPVGNTEKMEKTNSFSDCFPKSTVIIDNIEYKNAYSMPSNNAVTTMEVILM